MNNYKIKYTPQFRVDLRNAYYYIHFSLDAPYAAKSLLSKVRHSISSLNLFPEQYSKVFNFNKNNYPDLRKIPINNYVIIYEIDSINHEIFILHMFHGSQNYLHKL